MKHTILALALLCGNAQADFYTGNDLLQKMDSDSPIERMVAIGYVMGVFDTSVLLLHCPPANVTAGQVRDMVQGYLRSYPAKRHKAAEALVNELLMAAWPCHKKGVGL